MDYTSNNNTQRMRQSMGPVDQPNWNGGPRLNHNPQVMNTQVVGPPNLSNAMTNQQPIIPIRGRIVTSEHVEKAIISMRDIWSEASPELKRRMKTELSTLVDNMTI